MNQSNFEYTGKTSFKEMKTDKMESMNMDMNDGCCMNTMNTMCPPIQECPQERVCHRYMCYEVPHIIPCNTRIINHHVYRHTYTPCFTSCEENVVSNVYDRKCC